MTDSTRRGDATVKQVAEYLGHHPETVRLMARRGEFPNAYMPGRGNPIRIPWADVEGYTETHPIGDGDATVEQVAEFLQLHVESVRIMARRGTFPNAYKAGTGKRRSPIRIPWADVERYRALQPRAAG